MDVFRIPVSSFDATLLDRLVSDAVHEDMRLEFKRELPAATPEGRVEFLKDVSAFANTRGGVMIYGVAEVKGTASAIIGLSGINVDREILRLEQTLESGVQPRIAGISMHRVMHPNGPVLVIAIPRSLAAPHMVWADYTGQFWSRNNGGKFLMDVTQVRQAMLAAGEWERAAAAFRDRRLDRIRSGVGLALLDPRNPSLVIHVLPLGGPRDRVDLPAVKSDWETALYPGVGTLGQPTYLARPNVDGWFVGSVTGKHARHVQVFREGGGIEIRIDLTTVGAAEDEPGSLNGAELEFQIMRWVSIAMQWFDASAIEPPYVVFVTLLNVLDVHLTNSNPHTWELNGDYAIDAKDVILSEQLLDQRPSDIAAALSPIANALWQAASWPRSAARDSAGIPTYSEALAGVTWGK
jgi:hypothetical protein